MTINKCIAGAWARTAVIIILLSSPALAQKPNAGQNPKQTGQGLLKVFILAGQSNMQGQAVVSMDDAIDYNGGKGNLVWSMQHSQSAPKMKHLKNESGEWAVRDDVQISFKVGGKVRKGGLSVVSPR